MSQPAPHAVLVGLDVHGIQRYLFSTPKLTEVIGASRIVNDFTGSNTEDAPAKAIAQLGLVAVEKGRPNGDRWYVPVRLGGGVVRLLLPDAALARQFIVIMSEWAIVNANGLEFDAGWVAFDMDGGDYTKTNAELIRVLDSSRQTSSRGNGFNGFPFTAPCQLTGDAAEGYADRNERLCRASLDKREYQRLRDERWDLGKHEDIFQPFKVDNPRNPFITDLESMQGEDPSDAYMAVVAVDLNNLGDLSKAAIGKSKGIEAVYKMRGFSTEIANITRKGFLKTLKALTDKTGSPHEFSVIERAVNRSRRIPVRPLVFGGDDLTFVMHAALAPQFAIRLASAIEDARLSSGVGIAFVKTKAPLSRAVDLAEALLARAKKAGRSTTRIDVMLCSAEIPSDANDRDARGERLARGPYDLKTFQTLLGNAQLLKAEIPSSQFRRAADGFQHSEYRGSNCIKDLIENIDRRLGGSQTASPKARTLLDTFTRDRTLAASFLDCVDLRRFIGAHTDHTAGIPHDQKNPAVKS